MLKEASTVYIETEIEVPYGEDDTAIIEICASYTPKRPAPACSNPDHPNYSDPGDGEEIEIGDVRVLVSDESGKGWIKLDVCDPRVYELEEANLEAIKNAIRAEFRRQVANHSDDHCD